MEILELKTTISELKMYQMGLVAEQSELQKKKILKQNLMDVQDANGVPEGVKKQMCAKNIFEKNYDWKCSRFGERHKFTDSKRSVNS